MPVPVQIEVVADLYVVKDNLALVSKAQEGVEAQYFENLLKHSGFRKDELASLVGIDPKTVDNYRKSNKKFTRDSAEKLLQLHRLFAFGDELFGSTAEFVDWLSIPSPGLNNQTPVTLLHSVSGIMEVEKQLLRLAHGYAA
jgi:putative toxin-antitoxin system antitoxin component (TIGR02293 family)